MHNLLYLSEKLLLKTLSYVDYRALLNFSLLCKKCYSLSKSSDFDELWKFQYQGSIRELNLPNTKTTLGKNETWKQQFIEIWKQIKLTSYPPSDNTLKELPEEAKTLLAQLAKEFNSSTEIPTFSYQISQKCNSRGAPLSGLGYLYSLVTSPRLKSMILVEMISNTFCDTLMEKLKEAADPSETIVDSLNCVLGRNLLSRTYYENSLRPSLRHDYPLCNILEKPIYKLLSTSSFFQLLRSISCLTGIELTSTAQSKLLQQSDLAASVERHSLSISTMEVQLELEDIVPSSLNKLLKRETEGQVNDAQTTTAESSCSSSVLTTSFANSQTQSSDEISKNLNDEISVYHNSSNLHGRSNQEKPRNSLEDDWVLLDEKRSAPKTAPETPEPLMDDLKRIKKKFSISAAKLKSKILNNN